MNPLKKYRQRKAQDRIAREIAARYGMLKEYEAARKGGLSPLEALEDWDLLTVENLKLIVDSCEKPAAASRHCEERSKLVKPSGKTAPQSHHCGLNPQSLASIKEPETV